MREEWQKQWVWEDASKGFVSGMMPFMAMELEAKVAIASGASLARDVTFREAGREDYERARREADELWRKRIAESIAYWEEMEARSPEEKAAALEEALAYWRNEELRVNGETWPSEEQGWDE